EQNVQVTDPDSGAVLTLRRIEVRLLQKTRDGDRTLAVLTNLPQQVAASQIADIYRQRWTIEKHFQFLTQSLNFEESGLGKRRAALCAFAMALVAANALAVVRGTLRSVHGVEAEAEISGYYLADEVAGDYRTVMKYLPPEEWLGWNSLPTLAMAKLLCAIAQHVRLKGLTRSQRGPKKPPQEKPVYDKKHKHYSTARLLQDLQQENCKQSANRGMHSSVEFAWLIGSFWFFFRFRSFRERLAAYHWSAWMPMPPTSWFRCRPSRDPSSRSPRPWSMNSISSQTFLPCYGDALANSLGSFFSHSPLYVARGFNSSNCDCKRTIGELNINARSNAKPFLKKKSNACKGKFANWNGVFTDENQKLLPRPSPSPIPKIPTSRSRNVRVDNSPAARGMADAITIICPPNTKTSPCRRINNAVPIVVNLSWKFQAAPMATSSKSK